MPKRPQLHAQNTQHTVQSQSQSTGSAKPALDAQLTEFFLQMPEETLTAHLLGGITLEETPLIHHSLFAKPESMAVGVSARHCHY